MELLELGEQVVREGVDAGLGGCERGGSDGGNGVGSFRCLLTEKGLDTDESSSTENIHEDGLSLKMFQLFIGIFIEIFTQCLWQGKSALILVLGIGGGRWPSFRGSEASHSAFHIIDNWGKSLNRII